MKRNMAIFPILAGFFVMSFCDIIGTVMNQVKAECGLSDVVAGFLPSMIFMWFFFISLPTGVLCGKIGRKNAVLVSMAITTVAMFVPLAAGPKCWWLYAASFALIGIGNTIIQAALPALMSNVVPSDKLTSRISLGQFVKAICAALTPVFVYLTATALGNWKLLFPLYGVLTIICGIWLLITRIPDERQSLTTNNQQLTTHDFSVAQRGGKIPQIVHAQVKPFFTRIAKTIGAVAHANACMATNFQIGVVVANHPIGRTNRDAHAFCSQVKQPWIRL